MTDAPDAPRVQIEHVDHAYGDAAVLHDVNLHVAPGSSVALLGASGCGKTTLLRIIAGLERPTRGSVHIGDLVAADATNWVPPEHRKVGMVFQDWALFPHLNVAANIGYGLPRAERSGDRVTRALELVGLADLGDRMPSTLSGGQQQRVALARALAPEPAVLLLDEPFSNLDSSLRVEVRTEVHRLLHELQITAVFVTHDQEEAFVLGDEVAVMRDGRIVQFGTPHALYTTPADRYVAEFVGSGSIISTTASSGVADSPCGRVPVSIQSGAVDVLFRPEQLELAEGSTSVVDLVEYYGHDTMVFVRNDFGTMRVRCAPEVDVRRGQRVGVRFLGTEAQAFAARPNG